MRTSYICLMLTAFCLFSSCKKEDLNAEAQKNLNGTWVANKIIWSGVEQMSDTQYTFIFSNTDDYRVIEVPANFARFQDKGIVKVTDDGELAEFTSTIGISNWTAKIKELTASTLTLEYARTYFDINGNSVSHPITATFQKQRWAVSG